MPLQGPDMPHGHDYKEESAKRSTYECLHCGNTVEAESHPGPCGECGGEFRNRANSLE